MSYTGEKFLVKFFTIGGLFFVSFILAIGIILVLSRGIVLCTIILRLFFGGDVGCTIIVS